MKNATDFAKRARTEMNKWGLEDWTFVWDEKAKRRWGQCRYDPKEIGVSKRLWMMNDEAESWDTLLHEIAHALAGHEAGHGPRWKGWARRVGARPERCYDSTKFNTPKKKYKLVTPCGRVIALYDRKPRWAKYKNTSTFRLKSGGVVQATLMMNMG